MFEFPQEISRKNLDALWADVWRIVEQLRLWEDRLKESASDAVKIDVSAIRQKQDELTRAVASANAAAMRIPFGEVTSTSTTVFTATVPGIDKLEDGVCAYIKNNNSQTSAGGFTLNVNGLGDYPVYSTMADSTRVTTTFNKAYTMLFVFNTKRSGGAGWDMYYGYNSDTQTGAYNIRHYVGRKLKQKLYKYKICFTDNEGKLVPSCTADSTGSDTNKTLNTTTPFNPFEEIFYYTTTTIKSAGDQASSSYMYMQYSNADLGYGFNVGTTLTAHKLVYVRCAPQADGTVLLDGDNCIVQDLPTTADGKVYIRLGAAVGTHYVDMSLEKPVYQYKDGRIQLWTGA